MKLGTITAAKEVVLRSTHGVIDAANSDAANVTSASLWVAAAASVGNSNNRLDVNLANSGTIRFDVTGNVLRNQP